MDPLTAVLIVTSVPGVTALVTFAKKLGVGGVWLTVASVVLGIGLNLAAFYAGVAFAGSAPFSVACVGLLVGLGSAGIYDYSVANSRREDAEAYGMSSAARK
jgi:hypothetical protein